MALKTSELRQVMRKDPAFLGVFALDRIPSVVKRRNVKLIVNLDTSRKPGSHWVAIMKKDNIGYYYDSFGRTPPPVIEAWLDENCTSWTFNSKKMQSSRDKTACGYLCITFLTNKIL